MSAELPTADELLARDARRYGVHATPELTELREALDVCTDHECFLSGGFAHVGPCWPCGCPEEHAVWECPGAQLRERLEEVRALRSERLVVSARVD